MSELSMPMGSKSQLLVVLKDWYMRKRSAVKSIASCPPTPAVISMMISLSSPLSCGTSSVSTCNFNIRGDSALDLNHIHAASHYYYLFRPMHLDGISPETLIPAVALVIQLSQHHKHSPAGP